jgi:hypothetical protein
MFPPIFTPLFPLSVRKMSKTIFNINILWFEKWCLASKWSSDHDLSLDIFCADPLSIPYNLLNLHIVTCDNDNVVTDEVKVVDLVWVSLFGELEEGGQVSFCPGAQQFSWRPGSKCSIHRATQRIPWWRIWVHFRWAVVSGT